MLDILVISSNDDLHTDRVCDAIEQHGIHIIRIDSENFLEAIHDFSVVIENRRCNSYFMYNNNKINMNNIGAVYCRDYVPLKCHPDRDIATQLVHEESNTAYWGLFRQFESLYWMNPPWADEMADNKLYQSHCAASCGLLVPDTLVTSSKKDFMDFYNSHNGKIVIKQLSPYTLIDDSEEKNWTDPVKDPDVYGFYTECVKREHLEHLDELNAAPVLLQQLIEKKHDIRVTVVGEDVFSVKIDSQSHKESKIDFRHVDMLPMENYPLPKDIKNKLLSMLRHWNIEFAACDFVEDKKGEIFFIEANVEGNWLWMESVLNDIKISDCIAKKLLIECKRRKS